jgi:hypothetical protein
MTEDNREPTDYQPVVSRRELLAAGASAATAVAGVTALTGTAAAWNTLEATFDGCSEVVIVVSEQDVAFERAEGDRYGGENVRPPLVVDVGLTDGDDVYHDPVEVTPASTTTVPGQHGGRPVLRYRARADERILGVIGNSPSREPLAAATIVNTNPCARVPGMPSIEESQRYQNRT